MGTRLRTPAGLDTAKERTPKTAPRTEPVTCQGSNPPGASPQSSSSSRLNRSMLTNPFRLAQLSHDDGQCRSGTESHPGTDELASADRVLLGVYQGGLAAERVGVGQDVAQRPASVLVGDQQRAAIPGHRQEAPQRNDDEHCDEVQGGREHRQRDQARTTRHADGRGQPDGRRRRQATDHIAVDEDDPGPEKPMPDTICAEIRDGSRVT